MFLWLSVCHTAQGQFEEQNRLRSYSGARFNSRFSTRGAILSQPNVSPYLALTDVAGNGGSSDSARTYFTQVRPGLDSRESQMRQQQALSNLQRTVNSLGSAAARSQRGMSRATGHPTRFGTYLHYFPGLRR